MIRHDQPLVGIDRADCPLCDLESLRLSDRYLDNELCAYTSNSRWKAQVGGERVLPGSGIIIPNSHTSTPFELSAAEWAARETSCWSCKR